MTIALPKGLPAVQHLREEGLTVTEGPLFGTSERPVYRVGLLNLMPDKQATETQFARALAETGYQIDITLLHPASHQSRNTPESHLTAFYSTWADCYHKPFDGLIITGAPIENLAFEDVTYWRELTAVLDQARHSCHAALFVCWAAQAALYNFHDVPKHPLEEKAFGVFDHQVFRHGAPCVTDMGPQFPCPVSRHTEVRWSDLLRKHDLHVAAAAHATGLGLIEEQATGTLYNFNHLEYDATTLANEYWRDRRSGRGSNLPNNYFPGNDVNFQPRKTWAEPARQFFLNWMGILAERKAEAQQFSEDVKVFRSRAQLFAAAG